MESVPNTIAGDGFLVHVLKHDPDYRDPVVRLDWLGWTTSFLKMAEVILLWFLRARWVAGISCSPWLYFLLCGGTLQQLRYSRGHARHLENSSVDVLAGQLPTPNRPGGERKILLKAPTNFRKTWGWTLTWIGGSIVTTSSVVAVYFLLARQTPVVTYVWLGFQFFWLVLRSAYFHVFQGNNSLRNPLLVREDLAHMDWDSRKRTLNLVNTTSLLQMHIHPRGFYSYEDDLVRPEILWTDFYNSLRSLQTSIDINLLNSDDSKAHEITFKGVIGDTFLSSVAWMYGSKINSPEFYDSCIVFVSISHTLRAVPCSRVLCAISRVQADVESGRLQRNVPRGSFNWGPGTVKWVYWIPCSDGRWLQACSEDLKTIGLRKIDVISDEDITQQLVTGQVNISHKHVDDIRKVTELSQAAGKMLREFLAC